MISLLRVDDKLLHGQISFSWIKNLKINIILIADDYIVYDEFMKTTLFLSKPNNVHLEILDLKETLNYINKKSKDNNILIIVNNIKNAYHIMENIPTIQSLNLGFIRKKYNTKKITNFISLKDEEIHLCKKLIEQGKEIEIRLYFNDKKQFIKNFIS